MTFAEFEKNQNDLLKKLLNCVNKSKFYLQKFNDSKIDIDEIKNIRDFSKLPFTTREDLLNDANLFLTDNTPARILSSSGTIGKPLISFLSYDDIQRTVDSNIKIYKYWGIKPGDRLLFSLPHALTSFIRAEIAFMKMGVLEIPAGTGLQTPSIKQVILANRLKANLLYSFPSFAIHLADIAKDNNIELYFEKLLLCGEKIDSEKIRERYGDINFFDNYGVKEVGRMIAFECKEHVGYHIVDDVGICEIIDPNTGETKNEGVGELVISVPNDVMPLLRYRTSDLIDFIPYYECECGLKTPLIRKIIRRIHLTKIKGNLVDVFEIEKFIETKFALDDFLIVLRNRSGTDELIIKILPNDEDKVDKIVHEIKQNFNIRPEIEVVEKIDRIQLKTHFVEEREQK